MADIDFGQLSEALNDKMDTDAGNMTSVAKERIVTTGMPDYTTEVTITSGWVAPYDCIGYCSTKQSDNVNCWINVDGVEVFKHKGGAYPKENGALWLVTKGSTVTFSGNFERAPRVYKVKGE